MTTTHNHEIAIAGVKSNFFLNSGKFIKIITCNKWESEANFTFKATIGQIIKMVFDCTGWTWEDTYSPVTGPRGNRNQEKVYRRGMIDFIAINNGCTLVSCGVFTDRKDHTNVMNSIKKFEERLDTDGYVRKAFSEVVSFCRENYHLYKDRDYTKEDIIAEKGE